ncbi:MAG: YXWGXW repeat-containing protein [Opitutus sp.]
MPAPTGPAQIVVTQAPSPAGTIVLTQAPPTAPQVVVAQPARPSSEYAWVDGHWTYRNGRYEWINGQWERPPFAGAVWIPPHSEAQSGGSYLFYEGHWSAN